MRLANAVFGCWQITEEQAATFAVPLADTIAEYIPDSWLQSVASTIDPIQVIGAAYMLINGCTEREKSMVASYWVQRQQQQQAANPAASTPVVETVPDTAPSYDLGAELQEAA